MDGLVTAPAAAEAGRLTRTSVIAGAVAALVAYVLILGVGVVLADAVAPGDGEELSDIVYISATIVAAAAGLAVLPVLLLRRRGAGDLLALRRPSADDVIWGLGGVAAAWLAVYAYVLIVEVIGVEALEPVSAIAESSLYDHVSVIVLVGIAAVLIAPLAEELFFRGFLLGGLSRAWSAAPALAALVLSSALFSALHFDVGSLIPFMLAGLLFGALYLRTGGVTAPVIAHFGFNVVGYFGSLFNQGVL